MRSSLLRTVVVAALAGAACDMSSGPGMADGDFGYSGGAGFSGFSGTPSIFDPGGFGSSAGAPDPGFAGSPDEIGEGGDRGVSTGPVVVSPVPPPPVSGGTLLALRDQRTAVVADPDRDQILVVDLDDLTVAPPLTLEPGDQPWRAAEDAAGRVHVVLRGSGALVTLDPMQDALTERRPVCTAARGVAYDPATDSVRVACAEGELVTLPASGGPETERLSGLPDDLRDVVVEGQSTWLSRFRSAQVLRLDQGGQIVEQVTPPSLRLPDDSSFEPDVAWRMIPARDGGVWVVHQLAKSSPVDVQAGGYLSQSGCSPIVVSTLSRLAVGVGVTSLGSSLRIPLAVDLAEEPSGTLLVASARTTNSDIAVGAPAVTQILSPSRLLTPALSPSPDCGLTLEMPQSVPPPLGQVVAIAVAGDQVLVQTREPSMLIVGSRGVVLPGDSRFDTGQWLFHLATNAAIACASCHPEGREDGHVWQFAGSGERRTQAIGGGVLGTEPFHWGGELSDFSALVQEVFERRMFGPRLSDAHVAAVAHWVDQIRPWPSVPPADPAAAERGAALFADSSVGCATCHAGPRFTDNLNVDVGTGSAFQVPSLLGVRWRAPYMHDGCAPTLESRFGPCGGTAHGNVSSLTPEQIADLVAYLKTL